jgi:hypothetical protein
MDRYYFISNDMDELQRVQEELLQKGLTEPQVRVLSNEEAELDKRGMRGVFPFLRQNVIKSGERGALIGIVAAVAVIVVAWLMGASSAAAWIPVVFLAVVLLGFSTWEGGLIGLEQRNYKFERFQKMLADGYHVLMVDVDAKQRDLVPAVAQHYRSLQPAGRGSSWVNPLSGDKE